MLVAFRRHTLLPPDDCLYAFQPIIPHLTRSALHRCLQRHGISRLPDVEGEKPRRQKFKRYPIGFFHIDIAEVQTAEGKLFLFLGIDRTSKFAVAQLVATAEFDTNSYSVPWRLIGERVRVLVAGETVRVTHAGVEVACHRRSGARRGRIIDHAHFAGVAGAAGRVMQKPDERLTDVEAMIPDETLLRPLAEFEAIAGGVW